MTGPDILRLFPEVNPALVNATPTAGSAGGDELAGYDEEQVRLMDEVCIVIDNDDKPIGSASKKICACCLPHPDLPPSRRTRGRARSLAARP
jgi:isopentenyl-diphosphate delta-isomerase